MRPTLFHIPNEVGGFPVFGVGILFWICIVFFGSILFWNRFRRQSWNDFLNWLWIAGASLFLLTAIAPQVCDKTGFPIRGYGVFLVCALIFSSLLTLRLGRIYCNFSPDVLIPIAAFTVVVGILGARVFYLIEYWDQIAADTWPQTLYNMFNVANGGLVVYGSILGGLFAMIGIILYQRLPLLATLDLFAPGLALGLAFGRLGCLMNGCCFGAITDCPCGIVFPASSPAYLYQLEHGEIPLAGFYLQEEDATRTNHGGTTLFSIKKPKENIWTSEDSDVRIGSVVEGSPAAKAGLKKGMKVESLAFIPNGLTPTAPHYRKLEQVPVPSRMALFQFFYYAMVQHPESRVLMVCSEEPLSSNESQKRYIDFHPDYGHSRAVHPTQIYSSLSALCLCGLLLLIGKFSRYDGVVTVSLFLLYSIGRFSLELFRTDEDSFLGTGLSVSQCVSILVFLTALGLLVYIRCCSPKRIRSIG